MAYHVSLRSLISPPLFSFLLTRYPYVPTFHGGRRRHLCRGKNKEQKKCLSFRWSWGFWSHPLHHLGLSSTSQPGRRPTMFSGGPDRRGRYHTDYRVDEQIDKQDRNRPFWLGDSKAGFKKSHIRSVQSTATRTHGGRWQTRHSKQCNTTRVSVPSMCANRSKLV